MVLLLGQQSSMTLVNVKKGEVTFYLSRDANGVLGRTLHYDPENAGAGRTVAGNTGTITARLTGEIFRDVAPASAPTSGGGGGASMLLSWVSWNYLRAG